LLFSVTDNPSVLFDLLCVFVDDGVRVCVGPGEGSNFQLMSSSWPNFCWKLCRPWSCPVIRTHGSEIAICGIVQTSKVTTAAYGHKLHENWLCHACRTICELIPIQT